MQNKIQFAGDFVHLEQSKTSMTSLNENIMLVNLRHILNTESSIKFKLIPEMKIACSNCGGIISYLSHKSMTSGVNEWTCELCGVLNDTNILDWENLIKEVTYFTIFYRD